jgi:processing peptidase subunit alpha
MRRQFSVSPLTHIMLAFEYQGGWRDVKGSVAMTVLQYLLGGGGSFSAGGPGKGMHSRLYSRVLNQHGWVENCTALTSIYNTTGLVGIYAAAPSDRVGTPPGCGEQRGGGGWPAGVCRPPHLRSPSPFPDPPPPADDAVSILCKELQAVATAVPAAELERAKAQAISAVLMNLESRAVVAEDIGRQVLTYGHR